MVLVKRKKKPRRRAPAGFFRFAAAVYTATVSATLRNVSIWSKFM